jgi:hypothetical protein
MMVELFTFQVIFQFLQTVSIIFGIAYSLMILQNQQKSQKTALETRQAQLLTNFAGWTITNESFHKAMIYWGAHPKIEYKEFKEQYPESSEGHQQLIKLLSFYELLGVLGRRDLVDIELVDDMFELLWDKFKPIVKGIQKEHDTNWLKNYEWLGELRSTRA